MVTWPPFQAQLLKINKHLQIRQTGRISILEAYFEMQPKRAILPDSFRSAQTLVSQVTLATQSCAWASKAMQGHINPEQGINGHRLLRMLD